MNKYWNSKYFEKNLHESHSYIFKSLEIKQYLQRILKNQGYALHKYKLNFSNFNLNIFISVYRTEEAPVIEKRTGLERRESMVLLKKKLMRLQRQIKKHHRQKSNFVSKTKYARALELYRNYLFKLVRLNKLPSRNALKAPDFGNIITILRSLNTFTGNRFTVKLRVREINHVNNSSQSKQILLKLRKFERTQFFKEGKHLLVPFLTHDKSARLLTNFIATQIKTIKRHNFFFNFLKESLHLVINQKISKVQGLKLIMKGRLNNAARAKKRVITIGKVPLTTINSNIDYSETTAFTSNGTIGVKAWVAKK